MPQYISIHRAPGLKQEEFVDNAIHVYNGEMAKFLRSYVNLGEGFIVSICEAENTDQLEEQFEQWGFPFDEIHEVQFEQTRDGMEQMLKQMGKI